MKKLIATAFGILLFNSAQADAKCCISEYFCDFPNEGVEELTIVIGSGYSCSAKDKLQCKNSSGVMIDDIGRCVNFKDEE